MEVLYGCTNVHVQFLQKRIFHWDCKTLSPAIGVLVIISEFYSDDPLEIPPEVSLKIQHMVKIPARNLHFFQFHQKLLLRSLQEFLLEFRREFFLGGVSCILQEFFFVFCRSFCRFTRLSPRIGIFSFQNLLTL